MLDLFGNEIEQPKAKGDRKVFALIGSSNHGKEIRQKEDYYATDPIAAERLLELEDLSPKIWEPCAGACHLADVFTAYGYDVRKSDIVQRRTDVEKNDFLLCDEKWNGSIVTNPPFSIAVPIIRHALDIMEDGNKLCMFLRILFLESLERKALFKEYPPIRVWVSSERISCAKNGDFEHKAQNAQAYAWYVWVKGYKGDTTLGWF